MAAIGPVTAANNRNLRCRRCSLLIKHQVPSVTYAIVAVAVAAAAVAAAAVAADAVVIAAVAVVAVADTAAHLPQ